MKLLILILALAAGTLSWADEGQALAKQRACLGCHSIEHIGISYPPAFIRVAEKHKDDPEHIKTVIRNGKGKMPAHPTLTDQEIRILTDWILGLAK